MKIYNYKLKKGFTLVELLVVISIIGVLASIALVSFQGVQKRSRDTQRQSDLKQYQTALEAYASKNGGLYPAYTSIVKLFDVCTDASLSSVCQEDPKYDPVDLPEQYYSYMSTIKDYTGENGLPLSDGYVIWAINESETSSYWVYCSNGQSGKLVAQPAYNPEPNCPF